MASNLQKKGFNLLVLDLNQKAVDALVALGATAAKSVADVARECKIVITMLPTSVEVEKVALDADGIFNNRSEEHTSELQSLMRISYAVFCLKKKTKRNT